MPAVGQRPETSLTLLSSNARFLGEAFVFILAAYTAHAQETPTLQLKNTEVRSVRSLTADPILDPVRCDSSGNIYFRTYQYPDPASAPVRRFTKEGKRLPELSVTPDAEVMKSHY